MKTFVAAVVLACIAAPAQSGPTLQPMPAGDANCAPMDGLSFVCGPRRPEDAIAISATRWLIVSGLTPGSGLGVIDRNAKTAYFLYTGKTRKAPDPLYPGCAGAPDPASFSAHGIALRPTSPGRYVLYVVSHGAAESVQVFALDARALLQTAARMRDQGELPTGRKIGGRADFFIGAADMPVDPPTDWVPKGLRDKISGGAQFASQFIDRRLGSLVLIGEQELGAFARKCLCDGVGDAPFVPHAQYDGRLALQ